MGRLDLLDDLGGLHVAPELVVRVLPREDLHQNDRVAVDVRLLGRHWRI